MNPKEFENLMQLYKLSSAQQAINKQINQDENLSHEFQINKKLDLMENNNSNLLNLLNKYNSNSYFTDLIKINNLTNFFFNSKPIASCIVSSSTSGSSETLISESPQLKNESLNQILFTNAFSSIAEQSKIMLKRKLVSNNDDGADEFNEQNFKKICPQNNRIYEIKDCENSLQSDNINKNIENLNYDDQLFNENNYSKINRQIFQENLENNRLKQNEKINLDLNNQFTCTENLSNGLLQRCYSDIFEGNLLLPNVQISDEKLIHAEILKNIKNYESYLDCNIDQCRIKKLRDDSHCNNEPWSEKSLTKRDETVRHIKWHKKRLESLNHGFLRFSSSDDCTPFYTQQQLNLKMKIANIECQYNRKQTHYHCIQPNCDKIYVSTSDVQMHSNYHRKDIQLSLDGFQRFRANEKCNKDYCIFNKQQTTHFHCCRENCKFTFKNKSDVEKHKIFHNKDFELLKDGFKKFLKSDKCTYKKCRFSKVCNHIHCMRRDCNYVLHSSGQLISHKRRHDKLDAEKSYQHYSTFQQLQLEKRQDDSDLNEKTGSAEFPIDLSLINFYKFDEKISDSQSPMNLPLTSLRSNFIEKSKSNLNLISNKNNLNLLKDLKLFEQFSIKDNKPPNLTKNYNTNNTIKNNEKNKFHKFKLTFKNNTNLKSLDRNEIDLMIDKYFTINSVKDIKTNMHSNESDVVKCVFILPKTNKDDNNGNCEADDFYDNDNTDMKSKKISLTSNKKYFHCKIINCNKILGGNISEILDHIEFHEQTVAESHNLVASESSEDLFNLPLTADSSTNDQNLLTVQNPKLNETFSATERSMQITSIDGLFNRKRGRPPKNRFVEVYLNNENCHSPQAVFTSFKLAKSKEKSFLKIESNQFKNIDKILTKNKIFDEMEDKMEDEILNTTAPIENNDIAEETDQNNVTTSKKDDVTKMLKSQMNNPLHIQDIEHEVSTTNQEIEFKYGNGIDIEQTVIFKDDKNFRAKEKIVKTVKTFFPQNSNSINSDESSEHLNPILFKESSKKLCKLKTKFHEHCNLCNMAFKGIEELKLHKCIYSMSDTIKKPILSPSINDLISTTQPITGEMNVENNSTEQPEDLSLNRVTIQNNYEESQNIKYFSPLLYNLHCAQKLALLQQQIFPYLAAQKGSDEKDSNEFFKSQVEQHWLVAMTAAVSERINLHSSTNQISSFSDILPVTQQTPLTNILDLHKNCKTTNLKKKKKNLSNFSEQTFDQSEKRNCNIKQLKDELIPIGYLKFRFNEDCQFLNCSYRNHQTHFHCVRIDCYYSFCDKTRFVQHTARHERLDKLMGEDFKQYRANMNCNYEDCEYYKNCVNQKKKSSHFHCLKCCYICSDTNKVVAHRRQHNKIESIKLAGFRKISNNEKCYATFQINEFNNQTKNELCNIDSTKECSYSLKQTHYHCTICDYAVLSRVQFNTHKHTRK